MVFHDVDRSPDQILELARKPRQGEEGDRGSRQKADEDIEVGRKIIGAAGEGAEEAEFGHGVTPAEFGQGGSELLDDLGVIHGGDCIKSSAGSDGYCGWDGPARKFETAGVRVLSMWPKPVSRRHRGGSASGW